MVELFKRNKNILLDKLRKKSPIEKFYDENYQFLWYVAISLFCTVLLFLIYSLFYYVLTDGNYILANIIAYVISFSLLYVLDRELFKAKNTSKRKRAAQATAFLVIRLIGLPIDSYVLYILVGKLGMTAFWGKFFGSLIMFCYNFISNKLFVFKIKD